MPASKVSPIDKPKAPPAAERAKLADEFAALREQLTPMKNRHDELKELITSWHPQLAEDEDGLPNDPNATATEEGARYTVEIGPCGNATEVTNLKSLFTLLTPQPFLRFVAACKPSQKALDEALAAIRARFPHAVGSKETAREQFLLTTKTGSRSYKVQRKFGDAA